MESTPPKPKYASSYEREIDDILEAQMNEISKDDPVFNGYQQLSEPNPTILQPMKLSNRVPSTKVPTKANGPGSVSNLKPKLTKTMKKQSKLLPKKTMQSVHRQAPVMMHNNAILQVQYKRLLVMQAIAINRYHLIQHRRMLLGALQVNQLRKRVDQILKAASFQG